MSDEKMSNFNWKQFFVVGAIALILGGILGVMIFQKEVEADCPEGNQTDCPECPTVNQTDCPECEECLTEEEKQLIISGYLIDELYLEEDFNGNLSDRELNLFDGEVEFNGKDYDAEEVFTLNGLKLLANEPDFEGVPYLTVRDGGLSYAFIFETSLDTSEIGQGDNGTITFNFLGKEVEVSEWDNEEITFTQGDIYYLSEGKNITVNDKFVTLILALDESAFIEVDGISTEIDEEQIKFVNGLQIKVEYSFETTSFRTGEVKLVIGEDIEITVSDGEEYAEDNRWEWQITKNLIGLELIEDFTEIDEDEEFSALALGEFICLPNDYVCVYYNGLLEEDLEEYTFDLYTRDSSEYVRVKGNFQIGTSDASRIYINITDIEHKVYNKDWKVIPGIIELGDTNSILEIVDEISGVFNISIDDFKVNSGLNWTNVSTGDENYLTKYGILVENPEDALKDNYFEISVPEEKLEGSITVRQGKFEEQETEENTEENSEE